MPGTWSAEVVATPGRSVVGEGTLSAQVTSAGEYVGDLDFALVSRQAPGAPVDPPAPPEDGSSAPGRLPVTGGAPVVPTALGVALVVVGLGLRRVARAGTR